MLNSVNVASLFAVAVGGQVLSPGFCPMMGSTLHAYLSRYTLVFPAYDGNRM